MTKRRVDTVRARAGIRPECHRGCFQEKAARPSIHASRKEVEMIGEMGWGTRAFSSVLCEAMEQQEGL